MVKGVPYVHVQHSYGVVSNALDHDQIPAFVIECEKGPVNTPILIKSPTQLKRIFGVDGDFYFALGGAPAYFVRACYGSSQRAIHYIKDTGTEPIDVLKLEARYEGSKKIYITFSSTGTGNNQRINLTVTEQDGITEYYLGIRGSVVQQKTALEKLVEKINKDSQILKGYIRAKKDTEIIWAETVPSGYTLRLGNGELQSIPKTVLGSGTGNVPGTSGDKLKPVAEQKPFDIISDLVTDGENGLSPSEIAHEEALRSLEEVEVACVVCLKSVEYESREADAPRAGVGEIYAPYIEHVEKMNLAENHAWRYAILGADENMNKDIRLLRALVFNNENVIFVGQGLYDVEGNYYEPRLATMAVAAKISTTPYHIAIWGGRPQKALRGSFDFLSDIGELPGEVIYDDDNNVIGEKPATKDDIVQYNEGGIITFLVDKDGIKIREGITTAQQVYFKYYGVNKEDEISVLRIINHAKYIVYDACYKMLGEGITDTFQMDLETQVSEALSTMVSEAALLDYSVTSRIDPVIGGTAKVYVDISITPVHAARQIDASIVVM